MSLSHCCGGILAHSYLQNFINSATFEGFWAWKVCLRSCHSISNGFKSVLWFGPSKNLNFVFLEPFRGGLAGVFGIIVLLHEPNALGVTNWRPDILLQDFLIECRIQGSINYGKSSRSWSCKAAPDHHTTTTMFYCWCDVLFMKCCVGFMPDVTTSKKFNFSLISPQNICTKVLGIIKIYFGKCEMSLCVLFGQQWLLPWNSPMDAAFAQSLCYCWIMTTDLNWGKWGLQFFRCCSGFFYDLLDESSLRSWSNFGRPVTPGTVHHCSKFDPFVDNGSDYCGSLESQSLRNGFRTLSRLTRQLFCFSFVL